jgi:hypothetical protein
VALVPLRRDDKTFGLLALGSEDPERFYPEMGTLYVTASARWSPPPSSASSAEGDRAPCQGTPHGPGQPPGFPTSLPTSHSPSWPT